MANLTTEQATELVNNGRCIIHKEDGVYSFHKFSGKLSKCYYEIATPVQTDLGLGVDSTEQECKDAFIEFFKTQEYKGTCSEGANENVW